MITALTTIGILLIALLSIASAIRGWKAYVVISLVSSTVFFLIPMAPDVWALWVWFPFNIAVPAIMVWYGKKGRKAFEDFFKRDFMSYIEKFQEWNQ